MDVQGPTEQTVRDLETFSPMSIHVRSCMIGRERELAREKYQLSFREDFGREVFVVVTHWYFVFSDSRKQTYV